MRTTMLRRHRLAAAASATLGMICGLAQAADFSASGFSTIGYAVSDQPYTYQRFIDNRGTFRRDSVAGAQLDGRFGAGLGATVQVKTAPATANDQRYQATVSWAFLSYRLSNEWLFRFGKQRIPLYLNSENYDVGATYDFVRLPQEMYSIVPSNDAVGASFSKTWQSADGEISLDGYAGESSNDFRFWLRDDIPQVQSSGASFRQLTFKGGGLIASFKRADQVLRIGVHRASIRRRDGQQIPQSFPFVTLLPGVGYYQVAAALPGPGIPSVDSVVNTTVTLGLDIGLPHDLRLMAEFARSVAPSSDAAPQGNRGYASVLYRTGKWTPYAFYAFVRSPPRTLNLYTAVSDNAVPGSIPGAAQINQSQRAGADQIVAYDQSSWAIGTSFGISASSKLKAEYMQSHIGAVSGFVDAPPGGTIRHQRINVYSLSYSVVF